MISTNRTGANWRFLKTYGAFSVISEMLGQNETLNLQALCRYFYTTGVPRINRKVRMWVTQE